MPDASINILNEISDARKKNRIYSIVFVGVNGVGKSTNLSKLCFWLLQNKVAVLIAACDTFRSGAVEQLKVHVKNLKHLVDAKIELFDAGYGKDPAAIALKSLEYAKKEGYEVVLIDTAGRMQDNLPLMRALSALISKVNPDKIVFVGEALVGNEALSQLGKFNECISNFGGATSSKGPRKIDGILLSKFDTVDDKVGAAVSMAHVTGKPIIFVGTGQTYTDLRKLNVASVVDSLFK
jgi:signal recognition particle receptor subunit alpha